MEVAWACATGKRASIRNNSPDITTLNRLPAPCGITLPRHSSDRRDQFLDLGPLLDHVSHRKHAYRAMGNSIAQELFLNHRQRGTFIQRGTGSIDLCQHFRPKADAEGFPCPSFGILLSWNQPNH